MPLKEWLIKKVSQKLLVPEKITEMIINEQFTEALKQTSIANSIEFSGFGKLIFLKVKAQKTMDKYLMVKGYLENQLLSLDGEEGRKSIELKIATLNKNIEHLKPKLR
jgi:hypothetical protein